MKTLIILYTVFSLLLAGLSVPMIRKKVKPNCIYGFRIPLTMNNPEIWYPVNRCAGWWLSGLAILLLCAALLLPLIPGMTVDAYAIVIALITFSGTLLTVLIGWKYARQLARDLARK